MLQSNEIKSSSLSASKFGCVAIMLNVGVLCFTMLKISELYTNGYVNSNDQQAEYQFGYDHPLSTNNEARRMQFITTREPSTTSYTPPTIDRSTLQSQFDNTNDKYILVDFGAHIDYDDANTFCQEIVGKLNGMVVGRGSALASVDKYSNSLSQTDQISSMVSKCGQASGSDTDCWIGLKWDQSICSFRWKNQQILAPSSLTGNDSTGFETSAET